MVSEFDVHVSLGWDVVEGRCWWWRGGGPLERPSTPRVFANRLATAGGIDDVPNQQKLADSEDERKGGHCHVVFRKARLDRVGVGPARHAHDAQGVHGPERSVVGSKSNEEMPKPKCFVEFTTGGLGVPVIHSGEQCKDRSTDEHVVEVGHDEVGIVEVDVKSSDREEHSRDAT